MRRIRAAMAVAAAWIGVVAGHKIAYFFAHDEATRGAHLEATGHGSFRLIVLSAVLVVPVVLVLAAIRALRGHRRLQRGRMTMALAAFQVPVFALLELVERGGDVGRTLSEPAVLVGVLIQVVVAFLSVWALAVFVRSVHALAERLRAGRGGTSPARFHTVRRSCQPALTFLVRARRRAPPIAFAS